MDAEEDLRQLLYKLGLTPYEISLYSTLVFEGKLSASELSKKAKIPLSKIYSVIQLLEMKGMVETEVGFPKAYRAVNPIVATKKILSERKIKVDELGRDIETKLTDIITNLKSNEIIEEKVWTLIGREEFLQKAAELVSKAKKSAYLLSLHFSINDELAAALKAAVARGCDCRVIGFVDKERLDVAKKYLSTGAKVRHLKHLWLRFAVVDEKWLCFRVAQPAQGLYTTVWALSPSLAQIFSDQYERLWKESVDAAPVIRNFTK